MDTNINGILREQKILELSNDPEILLTISEHREKYEGLHRINFPVMGLGMITYDLINNRWQ